MKRPACLFTASLALALSAHAQVLVDDDFEGYSGGTPSGWSIAGNPVLTATAGLAGSEDAVKFGITATGSSTTLAFIAFSNGTDGNQIDSSDAGYQLKFDFKMLSTGNVPSDGDRILNFNLRNELATPIINSRVLWDETVNNGTLQFFDGSSWQSIPGQTELINRTDEYRLTIVGSMGTNTSTSSYSVSIYNITDSTSAGSSGTLAYFQNNPAEFNISRVVFDRGRAVADYVFDNVNLQIIPEPRAYGLILGLTLALLTFGRRGREPSAV